MSDWFLTIMLIVLAAEIAYIFLPEVVKKYRRNALAPSVGGREQLSGGESVREGEPEFRDSVEQPVVLELVREQGQPEARYNSADYDWLAIHQRMESLVTGKHIHSIHLQHGDTITLTIQGDFTPGEIDAMLEAAGCR